MKIKVVETVKILSLSLLIGLICGAIGAGFHWALSFAGLAFLTNSWLLYLLVPGGSIIVALYKLCKVDGKYSTVSVITAVRNGEKVPAGLSVSIFLSTFVTHIFGGSSGREGAALQLGGSIASVLSSISFFKLNEENRRTITLCGMSALFAALFGTPLAAFIFVLSIINVKHLYKISFIPSFLSSISAYGVAYLLGSRGEKYDLPGVSYNADTLGKLALITLLSALLSMAFVYSIEYGKKFSSLIKNEYLRITVGGAVVIGLTLLVGNYNYNGTGAGVIHQAIGGSATPEAFALKLLFTVVTLSFGYKGGEIVPSFFVGSTFGCVMGSLLGIDPCISAAVGMMALFCGVTNCPLATIIMSAEIFGIEYLPVFIPACAVSFIFSGKHSLYGSRHFDILNLFRRKKKVQ